MQESIVDAVLSGFYETFMAFPNGPCSILGGSIGTTESGLCGWRGLCFSKAS